MPCVKTSLALCRVSKRAWLYTVCQNEPGSILCVKTSLALYCVSKRAWLSCVQRQGEEGFRAEINFQCTMMNMSEQCTMVNMSEQCTLVNMSEHGEHENKFPMYNGEHEKFSVYNGEHEAAVATSQRLWTEGSGSEQKAAAANRRQRQGTEGSCSEQKAAAVNRRQRTEGSEKRKQ